MKQSEACRWAEQLSRCFPTGVQVSLPLVLPLPWRRVAQWFRWPGNGKIMRAGRRVGWRHTPDATTGGA